MSASHPDFKQIQRRLRRLDPSWYPESLALDSEYGPAMADGIDSALTLIEKAKGLGPMKDPAVVPTSSAARLGRFAFLLSPPQAPLMVRLAIDMIGTLEAAGPANNPVIVQWADEVQSTVGTAYARWAADWYSKDSVPWCGLFMAVIACRAAQKRSERFPPEKYLSALEWANFGDPVDIKAACVGDVMVLGRQGGGHVCLNVGEEAGGKRFFGLGGNQGDAVTIAPFSYDRVRHVRRPKYAMRPAGSRRVVVDKSGQASSANEG